MDREYEDQANRAWYFVTYNSRHLAFSLPRLQMLMHTSFFSSGCLNHFKLFSLGQNLEKFSER